MGWERGGVGWGPDGGVGWGKERNLGGRGMEGPRGQRGPGVRHKGAKGGARGVRAG